MSASVRASRRRCRDGPDSSAPRKGGAAGGSDFSGTNVQEAGIDEPDLVKTDGSLIVALAGNRLHTVDARAETPALLDSLSLKEAGADGYAYAQELLLSGDRALVFVGEYPGTRLIEVDLSDPSALTVTRTFKAEGSYVSARLHDDVARVVLSAYPDFPVPVDGAAERRKPTGRRAWLPSGVARDRVTGAHEKSPLVPCRQVRRPTRFSGLEMLTVLTVDLSAGLPPVDSDAVMTYGDTVYGSAGSLYVATQRWAGPDASPDRVSDVDTQIHKFSLGDEPPTTEYAASGEVPGFMLSQWSMSEHEDVLRVASTSSPPWDGGDSRGESESFVTALAEQGDRLVPVGRVGGLGRGERIYAVRFIGEVGYVVTFRQVDPLYVVDLSDPTGPAVTGELKIPGYSAYLHPVGDGLLLGIGQEATEQGRLRGLQLSLFDVSDPSNPVRLHQRVVSTGSSSDVEYDHRAFLWWPPEALAAMPVSIYGPNGFEDQFTGALGFRVGGESGIEEVARIEQGTEAGYDPISRALVVGDRLFTLSERGLLASDLQTFERGAFVAFPEPEGGTGPPIGIPEPIE